MPKHDKTLRNEIDEAIRENIEKGLMVEVEPGKFSMTPEGIAYVKAMLKERP